MADLLDELTRLEIAFAWLDALIAAELAELADRDGVDDMDDRDDVTETAPRGGLPPRRPDDRVQYALSA